MRVKALQSDRLLVLEAQINDHCSIIESLGKEVIDVKYAHVVDSGFTYSAFILYGDKK